MAFKNVRNLLLIKHNDGFIDDDEFVVLYDLYASKNLDFPYSGEFCFALENETYEFSRKFCKSLTELKISKMICRWKIRRR